MDTLTSLIDHRVLQAIAPRAPASKIASQQKNIAAFGPLLPVLLPKFKVDTVLRISHNLAQVGHESDGFCTTTEYATREAYEGRKDLGNLQKGDGVRFKGRGLIQLTGRDNYRAFTRWISNHVAGAPDFEKTPELVAIFPWAAWCVFYYWSTRNLNALADQDDLIAVTQKVNGGRNGLDDRANYLRKIKTEIFRIEADRAAFRQGTQLLRRGSTGVEVEALQRALKSAGVYSLSIDAIYGPGTEQAVRLFQKRNLLTVDGLVGRRTWAELEKFMPKEAA